MFRKRRKEFYERQERKKKGNFTNAKYTKYPLNVEDYIEKPVTVSKVCKKDTLMKKNYMNFSKFNYTHILFLKHVVVHVLLNTYMYYVLLKLYMTSFKSNHFKQLYYVYKMKTAHIIDIQISLTFKII